ncbi:hypothetical protein NFX37_14760 [Serratia marcescens]|nr:hypothetical protein NFX37_14760 [Serratia marcescens]
MSDVHPVSCYDDADIPPGGAVAAAAQPLIAWRLESRSALPKTKKAPAKAAAKKGAGVQGKKTLLWDQDGVIEAKLP